MALYFNNNGNPYYTENEITKRHKDFYISYNPRKSNHYGIDTTALYIYETNQYLILNGNHSKGYENLKTVKECVKYFYDNIKHANNHSEHGKIFKKINGKFRCVNGGY